MRIPRLKPYQIALEALCLLLLLAGIVLTAIKYPGLPAKIPNHFDAAGNVTDYAGKGAIWVVEGINIGLYAMMTLFIFIPSILRNPNVTWVVNPAARPVLESETISLLSEVKAESVALLNYTLLPMASARHMTMWPMWLILGIMTVGMILRIIRMKKLTAAPKRPWER